MWLRDFLPKHFPNTRIMTYGYDSSLTTPNRSNLTDYRRNFRQCLRNARRDCPVCLGQLIPPEELEHSGSWVSYRPVNSLEPLDYLYWTQLRRDFDCSG